MPFIHEFSFEVGNDEKHTVFFQYEKWTGKVSVKVDDVEVYKTYILFIFQAYPRTFSISVGSKENHQVKFDFVPGAFFFIKPKITAYVDSKVVKIY